jgi:hypothetical protein
MIKIGNLPEFVEDDSQFKIESEFASRRYQQSGDHLGKYSKSGEVTWGRGEERWGWFRNRQYPLLHCLNPKGNAFSVNLFLFRKRHAGVTISSYMVWRP